MTEQNPANSPPTALSEVQRFTRAPESLPTRTKRSTTRTRTLSDLFRAIASDDLEGATAIALRLCDLEDEKGHRTVARQLRGSLAARPDSPFPHGTARDLPFAMRGDALSTALVRLTETTALADVTLTAAVRSQLQSVVSEWTHRAVLSKLRIAPSSKLLFHGPPGCGKSLTAKALGAALGLPVYMVRFDAVIGAFLGQTAIHLRQLFHFAESTPCVLLLDELDALGKRRGSPLDVGELDRIVISLLQELEHAKPKGIVIATTNRAKHLDEALWRRFDMNIQFRAPPRNTLRTFAQRLAAERKIALTQTVLRTASHADSFATAEQIVLSAVRRQVLERRGKE